MIELHQFTDVPNTPDLSNYCAKVELYLKSNGIEYKRVVGSPRVAPKKKLPMIKDEDRVICDSEHIIQYLNEKLNISMDQHLNPYEKAVSYSVQKLVDEYLYFILLYSRWQDDEGWAQTLDAFFSDFPYVIRRFIVPLVRKGVMKKLSGHGISRHTPKEIYDFADEAFTHIAHILGDKKYLMGDQLTQVDMSLFSVLYAFGHSPVKGEATRRYSRFINLNSYCKRIADQYYPGAMK